MSEEKPRNVKQVIVVRKDLNMRKGKMVAQGSHASMKDLLYRFRKVQKFGEGSTLLALLINFACPIMAGVILSCSLLNAQHIAIIFLVILSCIQISLFVRGFFIYGMTESERLWYYGNFRKICVYVNSEQELLDVYEKAKAKNLKAHLVEDAGLTEFNGVKTKTCIAIGPHFDEDFEEVTGKLPLL